jgi:hypothetical protein
VVLDATAVAIQVVAQLGIGVCADPSAEMEITTSMESREFITRLN